jgi:hypothetical protein
MVEAGTLLALPVGFIRFERRREHTISTEDERLLAMAEDALSGAL